MKAADASASPIKIYCFFETRNCPGAARTAATLAALQSPDQKNEQVPARHWACACAVKRRVRAVADRCRSLYCTQACSARHRQLDATHNFNVKPIWRRWVGVPAWHFMQQCSNTAGIGQKKDRLAGLFCWLNNLLCALAHGLTGVVGRAFAFAAVGHGFFVVLFSLARARVFRLFGPGHWRWISSIFF